MNRVRSTGETGVLLITHTSRLLRHIPADFVHVFSDGRIIHEGGMEVAQTIDEQGYEPFLGAKA